LRKRGHAERRGADGDSHGSPESHGLGAPKRAAMRQGPGRWVRGPASARQGYDT